MSHKLTITPMLLAAIQEATDESGVADLTDADRLALYLQTFAGIATNIAGRIRTGKANESHANRLDVFAAKVVEVAVAANAEDARRKVGTSAEGERGGP